MAMFAKGDRHLMNEESLFIRTLDHLHQLINSNDEYEILRASALIRQLFLDDRSSLFDKVNRKYRYKIEFEVVEHLPPSIPDFSYQVWCVIDGIDPRATPAHLPRAKKKRDSFFGMIVAIVDSHRYSIRDLVLFAANVMGGVHSGTFDNDKSKSFSQLKDLYIFSNINVALLFIKTIGRIILESLKPLQYEVLDLARFENQAGISIYFSLTLYPLPDKQTYIFDIGTEEMRNRISTYLDYKGELSFRFYDSTGRHYLVQAGPADLAYSYGKPTYLAFQAAIHKEELFLCIEASGWRHLYISPAVSQDIFKEFHYVLGSDIFGNAESNMSIMEQCVFSKILHMPDQIKMRQYLERRLRGGYSASVRFEGKKFLHSTNHPNFLETEQIDYSGATD